MHEAVYLLTAAGFVLVAIVMVGRGVRRRGPGYGRTLSEAERRSRCESRVRNFRMQ